MPQPKMKLTNETGSPSRILADPLRLTAGALFLQFVIIVFASFLLHKPVYFIAPGPFLGWDYHAFYSADQAWIHGANPYSVLRYAAGPPALVTPPPSLLAGLIFAPLPFTIARTSFLLLNVTVILCSLARLASHLQLPKPQIYLLLSIVLAYYPFYSVIERGNVDGLILAALVIAQTNRHRLAIAASVAASIVIKVYPAILILAFFRRRYFRMVMLVLVLSIMFLLPFSSYLSSFAESMFSGTDRFQFNENISPAAMFWYSGIPGWEKWFVGLWLSSFLLMLYRDKEEENVNLFRYAPWMVSFPQLVLSHSGILFLPLLALLANVSNSRPLRLPEKFLMFGILLTSVQAVPFALLFSESTVFRDLFYLCAPIGNTMVLLAACAGALENTSETTSVPEQASSIGAKVMHNGMSVS
jgi:Glycosyltransferase family 87